MKKSTFKPLMLFVVSIMFNFNVTAQVTWFSDPDSETTYTTKFDRFDTNGTCRTNPSNATQTVTRSGAGSRGHVWRIDKKIGRLRAELSRTKDFQIKNNQGRYYSWEMKINQPTDSSGSNVNVTDDVTIWQWKSDENDSTTSNNRQTLSQQNYPLNMEFVNGNLELCAWRPQWPNWDNKETNRISISSRKVVLWKIPVDHTKWMKFTIRIFASNEYNDRVPTNRETSTSSPKGFIEFWFNDVKQTLTNVETVRTDQAIPNSRFTEGGKRVALRTYDGIEGVYPKWGIYNQESCQYNMRVLIDNIQVTQKFSDIKFPLSANNSSSKTIDNNRKLISTHNNFTKTSAKNINVYPNPVNDFFNINLNGFTSGKIEILNILGRVVYKTTTTNDNIQITKDTRFTPGLYIVRVTNAENKIFTNKIIIN